MISNERMNTLIERSIEIAKPFSDGRSEVFNAVLAHLIDNENTEHLDALERAALEASLPYFVADLRYTESGFRDGPSQQDRADAHQAYRDAMTALAKARGLM